MDQVDEMLNEIIGVDETLNQINNQNIIQNLNEENNTNQNENQNKTKSSESSSSESSSDVEEEVVFTRRPNNVNKFCGFRNYKKNPVNNNLNNNNINIANNTNNLNNTNNVINENNNVNEQQNNNTNVDVNNNNNQNQIEQNNQINENNQINQINEINEIQQSKENEENHQEIQINQNDLNQQFEQNNEINQNEEMIEKEEKINEIQQNNEMNQNNEIIENEEIKEMEIIQQNNQINQNEEMIEKEEKINEIQQNNEINQLEETNENQNEMNYQQQEKEEQTNEITTENNEINNQSIPDENNETNDIIQSIPVETTKTPQYLDFDDISSESPRFDASETQTNQQNNQISINSHESQHNENTPEEKHNQFVKMSSAQRGLSPPAKPFLAQHNQPKRITLGRGRSVTYNVTTPNKQTKKEFKNQLKIGDGRKRKESGVDDNVLINSCDIIMMENENNQQKEELKQSNLTQSYDLTNLSDTNTSNTSNNSNNSIESNNSVESGESTDVSENEENNTRKQHTKHTSWQMSSSLPIESSNSQRPVSVMMGSSPSKHQGMRNFLGKRSPTAVRPQNTFLSENKLERDNHHSLGTSSLIINETVKEESNENENNQKIDNSNDQINQQQNENQTNQNDKQNENESKEINKQINSSEQSSTSTSRPDSRNETSSVDQQEDDSKMMLSFEPDEESPFQQTNQNQPQHIQENEDDLDSPKLQKLRSGTTVPQSSRSNSIFLGRRTETFRRNTRREQVTRSLMIGKVKDAQNLGSSPREQIPVVTDQINETKDTDRDSSSSEDDERRHKIQQTTNNENTNNDQNQTTSKEFKINSLFDSLPTNARIEDRMQTLRNYEKEIDIVTKEINKNSFSSTYKETLTPQQRNLLEDTIREYPRHTIEHCYEFKVSSVTQNQLLELRELLYKLEATIININEKIHYPHHNPVHKQRVPEFVWKKDDVSNQAYEMFILKMQIRRAFYELYGMLKTVDLTVYRNQVRHFNSKIANISEGYQRKKEKIINQKRSVLVKMSLKNESKGIETDENGDVNSGSMGALIRWAINPNIDNNIKFIETLLVTYRQYLTPIEFFTHLTSIFAECRQETDDKQLKEKNHKTELKIVLMICKWMSSFPHDFMDEGKDGGVLPYLEEFIKGCDYQHDPLIKKINNNKNLMVNSFAQKLTIEQKLDIENVEEEYSISTLPTEQFAQQLTLYEYELFKSIEAKELLGNAWTKKDKEVRSPNLCALVDHFNAVTNWVISSILNESNVKIRAQIVKKFISIGVELLRLNNYNGVFELYSGLNATPIGRLKLTWAEVGKFAGEMKKLSEVTVPMKSYQAYRAEIKAHQNFPCIPFFGVYLQDLTFIHEGNEDKMENGDVNFYKCSLTTKVIDDMLFYKRYYEYYRNTEILAYIRRKIEIACLNLDENELYKKSLVVEPRQPTN